VFFKHFGRVSGHTGQNTIRKKVYIAMLEHSERFVHSCLPSLGFAQCYENIDRWHDFKNSFAKKVEKKIRL
jgi:hypothetical protein